MGQIGEIYRIHEFDDISKLREQFKNKTVASVDINTYLDKETDLDESLECLDRLLNLSENIYNNYWEFIEENVK